MIDRRAGLAALAVLALATGCTSSTPSAGSSSPSGGTFRAASRAATSPPRALTGTASPGTATTGTASPGTAQAAASRRTPPRTIAPTTPAATGPVSSSAAPTTGPATPDNPTPRTPTPRTPAPRSTCRHLMIRVIRGGAAPGVEFAALQFENTASGSCVLAGVPTVTLRRDGAPIGTASQPIGPSAAQRRYRLAPGATAESRVKDFSDCNASLSDTIRVVAPGSAITVTRPAELRGCRLRVYPLTGPQ